MPDVIVTQFRLSDNDVILRLRRVPHPKMYTFGDSFEEYTHSPMESSVYVDPSRSAAFMVARSGYGDYILFVLDVGSVDNDNDKDNCKEVDEGDDEKERMVKEGNLHHKGKQLYLRPTRSRRSADDHNEHAVSPLVDIPVIDFGDDYYDTMVESTEGNDKRKLRHTPLKLLSLSTTVTTPSK
ncbi:hypothetical protein C0Q70_07480 [Pomacea canaliculata]|uniref:Uncharacterized protein n=1 Tax=Pomacea canaliculata TaxID=400727 RepID=A0A2T7PF76_POMCA|nr:hypothetical protein C0Q70_07480 [Pomacea canaliculata]